MNSSFTPTFEEMIYHKKERWAECEGTPEATLLRLALLREISTELHPEKSRCLAMGLKTEAREIKEWESKIETLRSNPSLSNDLAALIQNQESPKKKTRLLPESFLRIIGRDKLTRYDRQWEAALAAEACHLRWLFWRLNMWVEIQNIEGWSRMLGDRLWPHGLILFSESTESWPPQKPTNQPIDESLWHGQWILVIHPRFKHPGELPLNLAQWPGAPSKPPAAPTWKVLYP